MASVIETKQILITIDGIQAVEAGYRRVSQSGRETDKALQGAGASGGRMGEQVSRGAQRAGVSMASLKTQAAALAAALAAAGAAALVAFARSSIQIAATRDTAKQALTALMGDAQAAAAEYENLRKAAELPGLAFDQAVQGSINLQSSGVSADIARQAMVEFGNGLLFAGRSASELPEVAQTLARIATEGQVTKDTLMQLANRAPHFKRAVVDAFGTFDAQAINAATESMDQFFERTFASMAELERAPNTFENSMVNLVGVINNLKADFGEAFIGSGGQEVVERLAAALAELAPALREAGAALAGEMLENLDSLTKDVLPELVEVLRDGIDLVSRFTLSWRANRSSLDAARNSLGGFYASILRFFSRTILPMRMFVRVLDGIAQALGRESTLTQDLDRYIVSQAQNRRDATAATEEQAAATDVQTDATRDNTGATRDNVGATEDAGDAAADLAEEQRAAAAAAARLTEQAERNAEAAQKQAQALREAAWAAGQLAAEYEATARRVAAAMQSIAGAVQGGITGRLDMTRRVGSYVGRMFGNAAPPQASPPPQDLYGRRSWTQGRIEALQSWQQMLADMGQTAGGADDAQLREAMARLADASDANTRNLQLLQEQFQAAQRAGNLNAAMAIMFGTAGQGGIAVHQARQMQLDQARERLQTFAQTAPGARQAEVARLQQMAEPELRALRGDLQQIEQQISQYEQTYQRHQQAWSAYLDALARPMDDLLQDYERWYDEIRRVRAEQAVEWRSDRSQALQQRLQSLLADPVMRSVGSGMERWQSDGREYTGGFAVLKHQMDWAKAAEETARLEADLAEQRRRGAAEAIRQQIGALSRTERTDRATRTDRLTATILGSPGASVETMLAEAGLTDPTGRLLAGVRRAGEDIAGVLVEALRYLPQDIQRRVMQAMQQQGRDLA